MYLKYDNMHTNRIFNALICINNHANSCIIACYQGGDELFIFSNEFYILTRLVTQVFLCLSSHQIFWYKTWYLRWRKFFYSYSIPCPKLLPMETTNLSRVRSTTFLQSNAHHLITLLIQVFPWCWTDPPIAHELTSRDHPNYPTFFMASIISKVLEHHHHSIHDMGYEF